MSVSFNPIIFTGLQINPASGGGGGGVSSVGLAPSSVGTVTNPTTTPVITLNQSNGATNGFLASTDWNTFNNKQSFIVNKITLTPTNILNRNVTLSQPPITPSQVSLEVIGGPEQNYGADFTVSGITLSWAGLFLDGVLVAGDILNIYYY
jgi:hypothetical protein